MLRQYDIYWAEVPFEDTDDSKIRPVIILDDRTVFVIGVGVTSQSPKPKSNDYVIQDWKEAGLSKQSAAKLDRKVKIPAERIKEKIGRLSSRDILCLSFRI